MLLSFKNYFKGTFIFKYLVGPYDLLVLFINTLTTIRAISKIPNTSNLYFFFPFYHIGGAEKVHLDIVKVVSDKKPVVFFTLPSASNALENEFKKYATCFYIYPFIRGESLFTKLLIACIFKKINSSKKPKTFSSNCKFYYDNIFRYTSQVVCIDLVHAFVHKNEIGSEQWSLPYVNRLNQRVVINEKTGNDLREQYNENGIAAEMNQRILLIKNTVSIPFNLPQKNYANQLELIFVSRNSPEKRVHLVGKVGARAKQKLNITTKLIGGQLIESVAKEDQQYLTFLGSINNEKEIYNHYANAHILLLLSTREGMPITIMEAMANGCAVISTNVGGIGFEIKDGENGFLVDNGLSEDEILSKTFEFVSKLNDDRFLLKKISETNFQFASDNFSNEAFTKKYRILLD